MDKGRREGALLDQYVTCRMAKSVEFDFSREFSAGTSAIEAAGKANRFWWHQQNKAIGQDCLKTQGLLAPTQSSRRLPARLKGALWAAAGPENSRRYPGRQIVHGLNAFPTIPSTARTHSPCHGKGN